MHPPSRRPSIPAGGAAAAVALALLALARADLDAQARPRQLTAELFLGSAWSVPLPLTIRLPDRRIAFRARYATRPLADAPYYAYRVGLGSDERAAETELVHHKLYLLDPPPVVQHFEVTHGYNLVFGNFAAPASGWQVRLGVGLVIAHPEGRIAGRAVGRRADRQRTWLGGGYHLAGAATQLALGRRYRLGRGATALTAAPEVKLTAAFARVPLEDGDVLVPNVALHALAGLGVRHRP